MYDIGSEFDSSSIFGSIVAPIISAMVLNN